MPLRTSLVRVQVGGRVFDAKHSTQCRTCMHPARMDIERRLIEGYAFSAIAAEFGDTEFRKGDGSIQVLPPLSGSSVRYHYRSGHMPLTAATIRDITEKRAEELGAAYDEGVNRVVDHVTAARTILQEGFDRIVSGQEQVDVRETLAAAKLLQDFEDRAQGSVDSEVWSEAMMIYFQTAQELMPPEMWTIFAQRLSVNPILRGLTDRMTRETRVVDSERTDL
jgi:hypothetical protein